MVTEPNPTSSCWFYTCVFSLLETKSPDCQFSLDAMKVMISTSSLMIKCHHLASAILKSHQHHRHSDIKVRDTVSSTVGFNLQRTSIASQWVCYASHRSILPWGLSGECIQVVSSPTSLKSILIFSPLRAFWVLPQYTARTISYLYLIYNRPLTCSIFRRTFQTHFWTSLRWFCQNIKYPNHSKRFLYQ